MWLSKYMWISVYERARMQMFRMLPEGKEEFLLQAAIIAKPDLDSKGGPKPEMCRL